MVNISDSITDDGKKFEKSLRELAELEVRIGIQKGEKSRRKKNKEETDGKNDQKEKKEADVLDKAMWNEFGTRDGRIPSRPFLRNSVDDNEDEISAFLDEKMAMVMEGCPASRILKNIGAFQKDLIQEKIMEGNFVPNAEYTKRKKHSDHPLVDTGAMMQSINYVIKKKGSGEP